MKNRNAITLLMLLNLACAWATHAASPELGSLSLQQEQYLSPDFRGHENQSFQSFLLDFNNLQASESILKADLSAQFTPLESSMNHLNIQELYWQNDHLTIGRKIERWSTLEDSWKVGLFQPRFLGTPLSPEPQGLTGAFLNIEQDSWGATIFASFLYIPDQGPNYTLKNGKFEKTNPWFQTPPKYVRFSGQTDELKYEIQQPEINDVVLNQSYAGKFYVGKKDQDFLVQFSIANKPAQQLSLGADGYYTTQQTAEAQINPQIFMHNLIATDLSYAQNYAQSSYRFGLSNIIERPQSPLFSQQYSYVTHNDSVLISPYVQTNSKNWRTLFSYLKINGGEATSHGNWVKATDRFYFREAFLAMVAYKNNEFKITQGAQNQFSIIEINSQVKLERFWYAFVNLQLIAVQQGIKDQNILASQFENHDFAKIGVSYVF